MKVTIWSKVSDASATAERKAESASPKAAERHLPVAAGQVSAHEQHHQFALLPYLAELRERAPALSIDGPDVH